MEFYKMYRHVGNFYPDWPKGWEAIVKKTVMSIEKQMWPGWIPLPVKWLIHRLSFRNSVERINYWWAYRFRQYLTKEQMITDVKEKFCYAPDIRILWKRD